MEPHVSEPAGTSPPPRLGVNLFFGTDTRGRRFLWAGDRAVGWTSWTVTGFEHDGTAVVLEPTRDLEPLNRSIDPSQRGCWILGVEPLASVDIGHDESTTRIFGYGDPGTPPLPEVTNGSDGRKLKVSFHSDYDGDLMMFADAGEDHAESWIVLVTDDTGSIDQPPPHLAVVDESTGYGHQLAGQVSWMVPAARRGMVHVIHPATPDLRIRIR
jgi:hypothetical protein